MTEMAMKTDRDLRVEPKHQAEVPGLVNKVLNEIVEIDERVSLLIGKATPIRSQLEHEQHTAVPREPEEPPLSPMGQLLNECLGRARAVSNRIAELTDDLRV